MLHTRRARPLAALTLAASLLAGCGPNIPSTLKIGVAQPLSGPSADRGQDLLNGVTLAVKELNASGYKIAGKPVTLEVVAVDDRADAQTARQVAQQLVDQKVVAVIGHLSSDITEATIPIYRQGGVPQLFTSSAVELTQQGQGNAFRLVAHDALQAQALATYAAGTLKAGRVAILYENTAFGTPMNRDVTAALKKQGRAVALSEAVDNKGTDFAAFVGKLKASPPDALIAIVREHQLLPLFEQMRAAGLSGLPVLATSVAKTRKVLTAPPDVKQLYLTSSALTSKEFTAGAAFNTRFRAAYNADPVWAAHYAYDAVFVLADALRATDSADPQKLREKLHTIDANAPVTNHMRFDAAGEQAYATVTVYQRRGDEWETMVRSDKW
ncbi:branched-chain amino acid ABC transporter substrate-binding protein [Aquabacterium sp.]|uniref:branched-chain amino acid ABC transporter substrate-binding protein n=1 Tax=Aquabacterium sp. TaxID=1872578 RepID=UPI003783DA80